MAYRIETERLLRPFVDDDFDALRSYRSRSDVARYLSWAPENEDEVRGVLARKITGTTLVAESDVLALAVVLRRPTRCSATWSCSG
jgi:RimJ/RimL family protein N-acetyltransferase